jgi:hypothetical protein
MNEWIVQTIHSALGPTGPRGFEGLIAKLLGVLTGRRFRLSRAGAQGGRDLGSDPEEGSVVAVECKRYGLDRELQEDELLAKLAQAKLDLPDLDLWALASSRSLNDQLARTLADAAAAHDVEFRAIETGDDSPPSMVALLACEPDVTLEHLKESGRALDFDAVRRSLNEVTQLPRFAGVIARLKASFSDPAIGYDHWRRRQNDHLLDMLRSPHLSRAHAGHVISVLSPEVKLITREATTRTLNGWWAAWSVAPQLPFAVLGEEGDGKTWALAAWLAENLRSSADFPPVVFVSAGAANSFQPLRLLANCVTNQLGGREARWERRLARWCGADGPRPALLLLLDGINERHPPPWWRELFESLVPWESAVAVVVTCRTAYWLQHFRPLVYLKWVEHVVPPLSDQELGTALAERGLQKTDVSRDLIPLMRKPRYLDLVCQHRERLVQTGDMTRERVFYEDWRDRYQRKTGTLDERSFLGLLMSLARDVLEGRPAHTPGQVASRLPTLGPEDVLRDLSTSGVLVDRQGRFVVQKDRLRLGFGLLLAEEVRDAATSGTVTVDECIHRWLEPEPGMDIKGEALEVAVLHALHVPDFPLAGAEGLLAAWVKSQNAPSREESFPAYFPLKPSAYLALAEHDWGEADWHPGLEDLLRVTLLRYGDSEPMRPVLMSALERWLGFVHPAGFASRSSTNATDVEHTRHEIEVRVGQRLNPGILDIAGHRLEVIERPGLLRLGRLALAIISCGPRRPFVHALVTGCVAEAVMDFPEKEDLFAWVVRSANDGIEREFLAEANALIERGGTVAETAARRLLTYLGSSEAFRVRATLPEPDPYWQWDPCRHRYPWLRKDALRCLQQADLDSQALTRALADACLDPAFSVPAATRDRLASFAPSLLKETLWSHVSLTAEDVMLETCEPALCALAPEALAAVLCKVARWFATREGQPLQSLYWGMRQHHLLFGNEEWAAIAQAWKRVMSAPHESSDEPSHSRERRTDLEADLFGLLLNALSPSEQLHTLLWRPVSAIDRICFEQLFGWPPDWDEVRDVLGGFTNTSFLWRTLWFLSSRPGDIPAMLMDEVYAVSRHDDARIRFMALAILGAAGSPAQVEAFLATDWNAARAEHGWEKRAGSWIWATRARDHTFREVRTRIELRDLALAVRARGFRPTEVEEYAIALDGSLGLGPVPPALPPYAVTRTEVRDERRPTLLDVSPDEIEIRTSNAEVLQQALDFDAQLARDAQLRQAVADADIEQRRAGNPWFADGPPATALEAVARRRPDLAERWVAAALTPDEGQALLLRHGGFLQELCVALLRVLPERGLKLRDHLLRTRGIGLIRDARTDTPIVELALWDAPSLPAIANARRDMILDARSDLELFRIVLAAEVGRQTDWLYRESGRLLASDRLLDQARAITLAGFMSSSEVWEAVEGRRQDAARNWLDRVVELGRDRRARDRFARDWFECFTSARDEVRAWAAFRLFLQCVDRRFWVWRSEIEQNSPVETYSDRRKRFLLFQEDSLERVLKKNENTWKKTLLGGRVLDRELWPWLS